MRKRTCSDTIWFRICGLIDKVLLQNLGPVFETLQGDGGGPLTSHNGCQHVPVTGYGDPGQVNLRVPQSTQLCVDNYCCPVIALGKEKR